jgi:ribose-phosphate pyrophosphokinase
MTAPIFLAMPGNTGMTGLITRALGGGRGECDLRMFPDGETYFRLLTDVSGRDVVCVSTLDRPNEKFMPLLFAAATIRELGARRVGLVAPYLAYMRQDQRFASGEAVTSRLFAGLISDAFDWLVTIDPHLHRYQSLQEIYRIPTRAARAAPSISQWIKANVSNPIVIGPDRESRQWVSEVAAVAGAPFIVLEKVRRGDRRVEISLGAANRDLAGRTPVLVDDIVSSGHTMIEAARLLTRHDAASPICIAVHGVFADSADMLLAETFARIVTTNSIPHASNAIDVSAPLAEAIAELASAAG